MPIDVRSYGAALNGSTDDTAAFQAALDDTSDNTVIFPAGAAKITGQLLVPNHKELIGCGVAKSYFSIGPDFDMAASGVVKMGTSENMGLIDKIGFVFEQPASTNRTDMIQYPAAIDHHNTPRVRIGHVRFSRAWNGIRATGNTGGATYDWIECGALNKGLVIDGALDTVNLGRFRAWPFGMSANAGPGVVYRDGKTIAVEVGKCDGLEGEVQAFQCAVVFTGAGASSAGRHLSSIHLDGDDATLTVHSGVLNIDYLYTTKSTSDGPNHNIFVDGESSYVTISTIDMVSSQARQSILVSGGTLAINGGRIDARSLSVQAALVTGGSFICRNVELVAMGARSVPYIDCPQNGPAVILQNNYFTRSVGSGVAIRLPSSQSGNISGNILCGRTVQVV